jgi:pyruvate dehydrogenase complex dehydrogenase (E1) component
VAVDVWSVTSRTELHHEGQRRIPYVTQKLSGATGPVIATTDYASAVPDQIRMGREAAERYRLLDVTAGTTGNAGGES